MRIRRAPKTGPKGRTDADGIVHDSKAEMVRWHELRLLERTGEIMDLERQVSFPLAFDGRPVLIRSDGYPNGRECKYTCDFRYMEKFGLRWALVIEDHKGVYTPEAKLRMAVFEAMYGIRVRVTGSADVVRRRSSKMRGQIDGLRSVPTGEGADRRTTGN